MFDCQHLNTLHQLTRFSAGFNAVWYTRYKSIFSNFIIQSEATWRKLASRCFAAACYYHATTATKTNRRHLGPEVTTQLVQALVTCRLNYCHSALAALPQSTVESVEPLQRVQNSAARMISNIGGHELVMSCVIQLHWLPVRFSTTYKLCILMTTSELASIRYLRDIVQPITRATRSGLRLRSQSD